MSKSSGLNSSCDQFNQSSLAECEITPGVSISNNDNLLLHNCNLCSQIYIYFVYVAHILKEKMHCDVFQLWLD